MKIKFIGKAGVTTEFGEFNSGDVKTVDHVVGMRLLTNNNFEEVKEIHNVGRIVKPMNDVKKIDVVVGSSFMGVPQKNKKENLENE